MGASVDENAFFLQFICCKIRTHIPILAGAQNGRMLIWKISWFFWGLISKMKVTCMLIACFVFWFFAVNAFFFQFLYCDIRKHIFIIIGAQNGRISCWKIVIFFWKISFWSLISKNNISCMLIACFIFCLFTVSYFVSLPFFFSS